MMDSVLGAPKGIVLYSLPPTNQHPTRHQDPLNFSKGKSAEQMKDLELKEIKNGRLAMVAIMGAQC